MIEGWRSVAAEIGSLDTAAMAVARERQAQLTKPAGSLGRLENLAVHLAGIQGRPLPRLAARAVVVMAADHGVADEGVSAYPQAVTAQMVGNFLRGGAEINVLARQFGARVAIVDLGVAGEVPDHPDLQRAKLGPGTANLVGGAAMSQAQAEAALDLGCDVVAREAVCGLDAVVLGDMGIGNTTAGAALVAALCGQTARAVVGRGSGIDDVIWERKLVVVERALVDRPPAGDPLAVLARFGGFEHAGLAGVVLAAAKRRCVVVVDGLAAAAAALVAVRLCPAARDYLVAGHRSVEPAQQVALAALGLTPLLDLGLRLGEGSGGALALPLLDAALALQAEMATFTEAGVAERASGNADAEAEQSEVNPIVGQDFGPGR